MSFQNTRIYLFGTFAGGSRRDITTAVHKAGATIVSSLGRGTGVDCILIGDVGLLNTNRAELLASLDDDTQTAFEQGKLRILSEEMFWAELDGVSESVVEHGYKQGYTAAMLAELIGESVATIRKWFRRGWITASYTVHQLSYFDFEEVLAAKRLCQWQKQGIPFHILTKRLDTLKRFLPELERPFSKIPLFTSGKHLLFHRDGKILDERGQHRFLFDDFSDDSLPYSPSFHSSQIEEDTENVPSPTGRFAFLELALQPSPEHLYNMANQLEEEGNLSGALDCYRARLQAGSADAVIHFQIAEVLYRLGDLAAARERYLVAIELDGEYVEARTNLACVLAELGELDMAVHAFRGALELHPDYSDVHYHLGMTLWQLRRKSEARLHFDLFLELSPASPWVDRVRTILNIH